jgi:NitT/TauT family transport system permease protein
MRPAETPPASDATRLQEELAGLEALEAAPPSSRSRAQAAWAAVWPKLAAVVVVLGVWELVVASGWRPPYLLPGPGPVFRQLWTDVSRGSLLTGIGVTLRRAAVGYAVSLVVGSALGLCVARLPVVRSAVGSLITGLQTMPSIAWFPLAILLFRGGEGAVYFVMLLGAAPAIANGLIAGIDHIPPLLLRAGRVLGARRLAAYRYVILPAAFPSFLGGLKQGWAFLWRSLMAAEVVGAILDQRAIGVRLEFAGQSSNAPELLAVMITILAIGILVDSLLFGQVERAVRRRWGLVETAG